MYERIIVRPVIPRSWLFAPTLVALASCSLHHPAQPDDASSTPPDADVFDVSPPPDADVLDDAGDDVADADVLDVSPPPDADVLDVSPPPDADVLDVSPPPDADVPDAAVDVPTDAPPDVADAAVDVPTDVPVDVPTDVPVDVSVDVSLDVSVDVSLDVPVPDVIIPDVITPDVPVPDVPVPVYESCADLPAGSTSGVYTLRGTEGTWRGYCLVNRDGSPAWTLVMKVDGTQNAFEYDSRRWESPELLNETNFDLNATEAKYEGYNVTPVHEIMLWAVYSPEGDRAIPARLESLSTSPQSLRALMAMHSSMFRLTPIAGPWANLVPGVTLSSGCQRFGLNVGQTGGVGPSTSSARVRIGGVGNSNMACSSFDSWIGVGGAPTRCGSGTFLTSAGGLSGCGDGGTPSARTAFVRVYVR